MITTKSAPNTKEDLNHILNPLVKKWFFSKFKEFSLPQLYGVMEIHSRNNILVSAPTGATKTLTGFLSILNELIDNAEKGILEDKIYCIYISPLKALNNDIQKNLKEPLEEIEKLAEKKLGIRVAVRTGDTTASEKSAMLKKPPHILITTPESLAIVLSSSKFVGLLIFGTSLLPIPDVAGVVFGVLKVGLKKFVAYTFFGMVAKSIVVLLAFDYLKQFMPAVPFLS